MNPTPEIKLQSVKKSYQMGEITVPVLKGIDLEIYPGEITVICGASGSGKSTLLNIVGGVDRPSAGEVWFEKTDLAQLKDQQLTEYRRSHVGFVFQFYNLISTLTARENVQVSTEIVSDPIPAEEALALVGLEDQLDYFPSQMSGGQQQRVAIARALAKRPRLMLCDEPTGALDAQTGKIVLSLLIRLNQELGNTIVIITHATPIAQLAHRIVSISSGRIAKVEVNQKRLSVEEISW